MEVMEGCKLSDKCLLDEFDAVVLFGFFMSRLIVRKRRLSGRERNETVVYLRYTHELWKLLKVVSLVIRVWWIELTLGSSHSSL